MPFIEIKANDTKILLLVHNIVSVEETDNGNCNITMSNNENYYDVEDYKLVKSMIKESKV